MIAVVRLMIGVEPGPLPMAVQLTPPSVLDHRPRLAMPAISGSRSGRADKKNMWPHSDSRPTRLPVDSTHSPGTTVGPLPAGGVTSGGTVATGSAIGTV